MTDTTDTTDSTEILAWWFAPKDRRLGYGDGRPIVVGEALTVEGEPVLCEHGLHASKRLIDALNYAQSPMLHRVRSGGRVVHGTDKCAATERTVLWTMDCTNILCAFARHCALDAITVSRWEAPSVVMAYLMSGRKDLREAAKAAALDAARAAAEDAARDAAWDA